MGFIDTSTIWLRSDWIRFVVVYSGLQIKLLIAALVAIAAIYTTDITMMLFWGLSALLLYLKILRSLNPFLNLDGYELLCTLSHCSSLRVQAIDWVYSKNKAKNCFNKEGLFWGYVLFYFIIVYTFSYLILNKIIQHLNAPSYWRDVLAITLISIFFIESLIVVRQHKQLQRSQII